jgi:phosphate transport system ATP-binding protein
MTAMTTAIAAERTKIRVRDLEFFYGEHRSLKSINMDIPE